MKKNYYLSGEFNLTCDRCSKKIKAHQAKHEWTGFIVCGDCYETRHPQDFVKAKTDKLTVPFQRPIPELAFLHLLPIFDSVTVTDSSTIQFTVDYNRDITDTLLANDSLLFDVTRILSDSQRVGEVVSIQSDGATIANDSTDVDDSGDILFSNYVDITYVDTGYVGTIITF
jgi:hypothetical protein